ncbi:hypothetical protein GCM10011416_15750 [Polaribacter pacificus]|uniref:HTH LytTR-type domain-containing protein n=1 Tax=Polaribacter pacificus TaxID=1775173 RepID=A0A917MDC4_9FLAO|nr:LytTR family DNA-binding domain-containing protein [Polaribacter pacificus]GGG98452.1 hypothetical protein GCM10011416_15750 [Polaribacter pacificus]
MNTAEHRIPSIWILIIHASIPFPIAYLYLSFVNLKVKDEVFWTLGKEIFHLSVILLLIGVAIFLLRDVLYTNPDNWSLRYLWEEIRNTFLVGFLLILIVIPLQLERLINIHKLQVHKLPKQVHEQKNTEVVVIKSQDSSESVSLKLQEWLFAEVESNYTEIVSFSETGIDKRLLRIPLKDLEDQLKPFANSYKTHRSYLVNLNAIENISGNAQGYQLRLKNYPKSIPVSRSQIKGFNEAYAKSSSI